MKFNPKKTKDLLLLIAGLCQATAIGLGALAIYLASLEAKAIKGAYADINPEQLQFIQVIQPNNANIHNHYGLLVYNLAIVNRSDQAITIKDIKIKFASNGKFREEMSLGLPTFSLNGNPSINLYGQKPNKPEITIGDWTNIRQKINEGNLLQSGEILPGSACYVFPTMNKNDISEIIKSMSLVVEDYRGNTNEIPLRYLTPETGVIKVFLLRNAVQYP